MEALSKTGDTLERHMRSWVDIMQAVRAKYDLPKGCGAIFLPGTNGPVWKFGDLALNDDQVRSAVHEYWFGSGTVH